MRLTSTALGLISLLGFSLQSAYAANATFFPLMNMTDSAGDLIQAHGGCIIQAGNDGGDWYWFGTDRAGQAADAHFEAVNCYKSADFSTWDFVGPVLTPIPNTNISNDSVLQRPKILYNNKNSEYVMWFHADNANYSEAAVGVATSKTIDGHYQWKGNFQPFGNQSRDMTVWKDPDTQVAYLIYATNNNADLSIARLTDDYLNVSKTLYTFHGVYEEAPGVFKIDGKFYLVESPQNGWTPTNNAYYVASSMSGPWSKSTLLAPDTAYTYLTQNTYDIIINGSSQQFYLYLGDHWNGNELASSSYAFYPVIHKGSSLAIHYTGGWTLDAATGTWADLPYELITAKNSTTSKKTLVACGDGCAGGKAANMTSSTNFSFTWNGSEGSKVLQIVYTYPGLNNAFQQIGVTVDGKAAPGNALMESTLGTSFGQMAPFPVTLKKGSKVVLNLLDYDGTNFLVDAVRVYDSPTVAPPGY